MKIQKCAGLGMNAGLDLYQSKKGQDPLKKRIKTWKH